MSKKRAAVIGAGFGGLATAIRLQAKGMQTVLFEKRDKPGGRAYHYKEKGFTFDAGPTVITAPESIKELFEIAGKNMDDYVKFVPVTPFYRLCWEDGYQFDYSNDEAALLAQIRQKSPVDVKGYQEFFKYSEKVFKAGYEDLVHVPFLRFRDMIKAAPDLIRLKAYRSVYSMVSHYIKDEQLRQAFSFHSLLIGGNPFEASSIYTLIHALERKWGVYWTVGGTNALVSGLVRLFEDLGGQLRLSTELDSLVTEKGAVTGVRCESGEVLGFDLVVSNADVNHTYAKLLRDEPRAQKQKKKLDRMRYSQALFVLYFGTNRKYENLAHHSILFCQRYKTLLNDIFKKRILPEDNSLYLHAPTRSDRSIAPEGCESFYALANVPNLKSGDIDWDQIGEQYADKLLAYLEEFYIPDLRKHLVVRKIFSPMDFKRELNAHLGTAFSLEPTLLQSAYWRVHNKDKHLKGLYFVGAGTHPGAGVPGVINSAKATDYVIEKDLAKEGVYVGQEAYAPA